MLLRTEQAAEFLSVKSSTLEAWRSRGHGPRFCKLGGAVRYRQADLEIFLEQRVRENTSKPVVAQAGER